ncbi:hypothetical protein KBC75_04530 [Candidatus Shapirobacteria bacterium]|nr:hypothetical protein [Candidatus Shapirobacteria bacterium]
MFNRKIEEEDKAHIAKIKDILIGKRETLEEKLASFADPTLAVQTIINLETVKLQLAQEIAPVQLSPQQFLTVLDRTEEWYRSRNIPYPFPDRLKEQREFWQSRT